MRKALVVGIDDYPRAPLRGSVNDARSMADILETHGDGAPNFSVRLMTSPPDSTEKPIEKARLREAIESLFRTDGLEVALFYFSGHGVVNSTGGYIVTVDSVRYDEGVSMAAILALANASTALARIIILDCCHSGAFANAPSSGTETTTAQLKAGMTVLTATNETGLSTEIGGRGVFSSLVVEALKGGAADLGGNITAGSVYAYVDQALGPWDDPRPIFKTNVSLFTALRKTAPPVPLETLRRILEYFPDPRAPYPLDPTYEFTDSRAIPQHVSIFKDLQKFESVGLVRPAGEAHMYFAAMNSRSCRLTALGEHYWRLVTKKRL